MSTSTTGIPFYRPLALALALVLALVTASTPAIAAADVPAQPPPTPDKSAYTLFNPTPRELMREMSTDRPDTTESPRTVDAGHFQIELSFIDWSLDRGDGDVATRSLAVMPLLAKVGLLNNVDLQVGIDPWTRTTVSGPGPGEFESTEGFGDTVLRLKINLWGNDVTEEWSTALALMPFIKIPTANEDLGNGDVEWGIIVPFGIALPGEFDLGLMAEIDVIRNGADDRYVIDLVHTATISHALVGDLGAYIEYAGFANLNHDEDYRAYFDAGLTYGLTDNIQLDGGLRVGLTNAADDIGLFAGISLRF